MATTTRPTRRNQPGQRPDWVDDDLFPFESRFVEVDGNVVHYVDEGTGPLLLLHHGNPTWSFLYRDVIAGLKDRFRCVAWDQPGFGLSTPRQGYGFTPAEHADVATAFVRELDLEHITPFVQDWGGPVGLAAAVREPERYDRLIVGNTWAWPNNSLGAKVFSNLLGGPIGREVILRRNVFASSIVPYGHQQRTLTDAEKDHYTNPFPTRSSRIPTAVYPRAITQSGPLLEEVANGLSRIAHLPALILWAQKDMAFQDAERRRWEAELDDHTTVLLPESGHYLQDDAPAEVVAAILRWWEATDA